MNVNKINLGYNLKDKELRGKLCELIGEVSIHIESNLRTKWNFTNCKDCFCDKKKRNIDELTRIDVSFVEYIISAVKEKMELDKANDVIFIDHTIDEEDLEDSSQDKDLSWLTRLAVKLKIIKL